MNLRCDWVSIGQMIATYSGRDVAKSHNQGEKGHMGTGDRCDA
jgi:hypothetical protein